MIQWQYFYLYLTGSYPTDSHSTEVKYKWVKLAQENSHSFGQADCFVLFCTVLFVIITGIFLFQPVPDHLSAVPVLSHKLDAQGGLQW